MNPVTLSRLCWRRLGPADCDRIFALHVHAIWGMGPDQVLLQRPEFFADLLGGAGLIIGACDPDGELVAYGALQNSPDPDTRPDIWLDWPADACIQKLAGASVTPEYRGHRLQRQLIRRRIALADPDAYLYVTAAPSNPASWRSLLREGFEIVRLCRVCGGALRYLLVRRARAPAAASRVTNGAVVHFLDSLPMDEQGRLLMQGWRGRFHERVGCVLASPEEALR